MKLKRFKGFADYTSFGQGCVSVYRSSWSPLSPPPPPLPHSHTQSSSILNLLCFYVHFIFRLSLLFFAHGIHLGNLDE